MEEEVCTKLFGALISFHEIMKLHKFKFGLNDVIPKNVKNIPLLVFFTFFVNLMEKEPFIQFSGVFDRFL